MTADFVDNGRCFVCGARNEAGLKLSLRTDPERGASEVEVIFPERFQGWEGVVHGGLLATVLDEAMIYAAGAKGFRCVTGEITVRYVTPVRTGARCTVRGRFLEDKGRIVLAESEVLGPDGGTAARASGKLFKVA
jgi:uncharacterized protein (TIGR00369 family)